jgi:hypothetical protein
MEGKVPRLRIGKTRSKVMNGVLVAADGKEGEKNALEDAVY